MAQEIRQEIQKLLKAGPEQHEVVGPLVEHLLTKGYTLGQIRFGRNEWLVPANPSEASKREAGRSFKGFPVDIAVFSDESTAGDPAHLRIIIETKSPTREEGIHQLKVYMSLEPAVELGVWANSADPAAPTVFLYRDDTRPRRRLVKDIPPRGTPIAPNREPLRYADLVVPSHDVLRKAFEDILNRLASRDPNVVRPDDRLSELCNLILLKLESDRQAKAEGPETYVKWQVKESPTATARHIRDWFRDFTRLYPEVFASEEEKTLRLADESIQMVVETLEPYLLLEVGTEAVAQAFQVLRTEALRSADGQFFTPQPVIEAGATLVGVRWEDLIIDPACGTGGFLMEAFFQASKNLSGDRSQAVRWAQHHIYGVDRDAIGVKLAKAVMQIAGDGSAHIFRGDSIRRHEWNEHFPSLRAALQEGRFDVVLTNPPFGRALRVSREDLRRSGYTIHQRPDGSEADSVEIGLVFLELAYWLLKPGGRVGIVLPETYFFSPSYRWLFDWLKSRFRPVVVANIAMEAFQQYARAKTNFYVFEKLPEDDAQHPKGEVVFLNPRTCGIDPAGRPTEDNELRDHVREFVLEGRLPEGATKVSVEEVYNRRVLVPTYYDTRYNEPLKRFLKAEGLKAVSLGELVEKGILGYRFGHGSPDRLSRRGEVPYIKVSDLRAGRVNVNPTNLAPLEVAKRLWRGEESGLKAWDLLTPIRASSNIGEFAVLLPGEERRVLTREILVLRVVEEKDGIDPFYLFWSLSLRAVRESWRRVALMQTNREDVGDRWREILIPKPKSVEWARRVSSPIREYLRALQQAAEALERLRNQGYEFVPHLLSSSGD